MLLRFRGSNVRWRAKDEPCYINGVGIWPVGEIKNLPEDTARWCMATGEFEAVAVDADTVTVLTYDQKTGRTIRPEPRPVPAPKPPRKRPTPSISH